MRFRLAGRGLTTIARHTIQHMNGTTRRGVGNAFKTAALLGALSALILLVGRLLGGTTGLVVAGIMALAMNGFAYFYSDKLALRAMRARAVGPQQAPWLHAMVAELVSRRGLPMPRVYISPSSTPNAFATGRNPSHAAVCVTSGILDVLDERELRGVVGHEISHVGNRDTSSVTAVHGVNTSHPPSRTAQRQLSEADQHKRPRCSHMAGRRISVATPTAGCAWSCTRCATA